MPELRRRTSAAASAAAGGRVRWTGLETIKRRCRRVEKGENSGAYRRCGSGADGETGSGRSGGASREVGGAAAQPPPLRPPSEHLPGARAMWSGLDASGLLDPGLVALVNRRVAALNGCVF